MFEFNTFLLPHSEYSAQAVPPMLVHRLPMTDFHYSSAKTEKMPLCLYPYFCIPVSGHNKKLTILHGVSIRQGKKMFCENLTSMPVHSGSFQLIPRGLRE